MGVIQWEELSDKEFKRVMRLAREIREMDNEELKKEISKIREEVKSLPKEENKRQELLERLELAEKEKSIRAKERTGREQERTGKKEEEKTLKEKKRWLTLIPKPLPPIWQLTKRS